MDISDAIATLEYLFLGTQELGCLEAGDADDSGELDLSDAVYVLEALFLGGLDPLAPFGECGGDPTDDELGCETFAGC